MTPLRCLLLAMLLPMSMSQEPLCDSDGAALLQRQEGNVRHRHSASSSAAAKPEAAGATEANAEPKSKEDDDDDDKKAQKAKASTKTNTSTAENEATTSLAPGQLSDLDEVHESESEKQALEIAAASEVTNVLKINIVDKDGKDTGVLKIQLPENLTATLESKEEIGPDPNVSVPADVLKSITDAINGAAKTVDDEVNKYTAATNMSNATGVENQNLTEIVESIGEDGTDGNLSGLVAAVNAITAEVNKYTGVSPANVTNMSNATGAASTTTGAASTTTGAENLTATVEPTVETATVEPTVETATVEPTVESPEEIDTDQTLGTIIAAVNAVATEVSKYTGAAPVNVTGVANTIGMANSTSWPNTTNITIAPNPKWMGEDRMGNDNNNTMAAVLLLMVILVLTIIVGVVCSPFATQARHSA